MVTRSRQHTQLSVTDRRTVEELPGAWHVTCHVTPCRDLPRQRSALGSSPPDHFLARVDKPTFEENLSHRRTMRLSFLCFSRRVIAVQLHFWFWCPPEGSNGVTGWGQEKTNILGMKKMSTQRDLHSSSPLHWKKSTHTLLGPSPSFPYSTPHTELVTTPGETAQTVTGSLEDHKTHILHTEKNPTSILHPGLHPIVANAFEPAPTANFSVGVVNRERGERSKYTLSIYRGGSKCTQCFCSRPTSVFLPQLPTVLFNPQQCVV